MPDLRIGHFCCNYSEDKDMDIDEHNPWQMSEELEKRFTVDEILDVWYSVYGKDMAEPKFIDELRQRIA